MDVNDVKEDIMPWPIHSYGTEGLPGMAQQMWGQTERRKEKIEDRSWNTGLASIKAGTATDIEIEQMTQGNRQQAQSLMQMRDSAKVEAKRVKEKQDIEMGNILLKQQTNLLTSGNKLYDLAVKYDDDALYKRALERYQKLGLDLDINKIRNPELMKEMAIEEGKRIMSKLVNNQKPTASDVAMANTMLTTTTKLPKELVTQWREQVKAIETRLYKKPDLVRGETGAYVEKGVGVQGYDKAPAPRYVRSTGGAYQEVGPGVPGYDKPSDRAGTAMRQNVELLMAPPFSKSPQEALSFINASKTKSRQQFTLEIYKNELNATGKQDKATMAMEEAGKMYDKVYGNQKSKPLDEATATALLKEAGGDKEKARKLANDRGYTF